MLAETTIISQPMLSPAPSDSASPARSSQSRSQSNSPSKPNARALSRAATVVHADGSRMVSSQSSLAVVPGRKTYGSARSYKKDDTEESIYAPVPMVKVISTDSPVTMGKKLLTLPIKERETYSILRKRWGVDEEGLAPEGEGLEVSDLKSITQLRAKGENSRFIDEFNYLVEGLEAGIGLGIRRAS